MSHLFPCLFSKAIYSLFSSRTFSSLAVFSSANLYITRALSNSFDLSSNLGGDGAAQVKKSKNVRGKSKNVITRCASIGGFGLPCECDQELFRSLVSVDLHQGPLIYTLEGGEREGGQSGRK